MRSPLCFHRLFGIFIVSIRGGAKGCIIYTWVMECLICCRSYLLIIINNKRIINYTSIWDNYVFVCMHYMYAECKIWRVREWWVNAGYMSIALFNLCAVQYATLMLVNSMYEVRTLLFMNCECERPLYFCMCFRLNLVLHDKCCKSFLRDICQMDASLRIFDLYMVIHGDYRHTQPCLSQNADMEISEQNLCILSYIDAFDMCSVCQCVYTWALILHFLCWCRLNIQ